MGRTPQIMSAPQDIAGQNHATDYSRGGKTNFLAENRRHLPPKERHTEGPQGAI
jgi:hypothetical protein